MYDGVMGYMTPIYMAMVTPGCCVKYGVYIFVMISIINVCLMLTGLSFGRRE